MSATSNGNGKRKRKPKQKGPSLVEFVSVYSQQRDITPGSVRSIFSVVSSLERWAGRAVGVSELTDDFVNGWVVAMAGNGMAKASAKAHRGRLLALWRAAFRDGHCRDEPRHVRTVKLPFKAPVAWSVEDVRRLLGVAESQRWTFKRSNVCRGQFFGLAIRLAWDTALRWRDVTRLKKSDFGLERIATITQSKTGRWHVVKIHGSTREMMMRLQPDDDRALPWTIEYSNFQHQFKRIVKQAGRVGPWKKIRKGSATNVEARHPGAGGVHLGHVNGSIAHNHYLDPKLLAFNRPLPTELTFADVAKEVTADLRLMQYVGIYAEGRNLGRVTLRRYQRAVEHLGRWAGGPVRCGEVTEQMVGEFLHDITRDDNLHRNTIHRRRMYLMHLLEGVRAELQATPQTQEPWGVA